MAYFTPAELPENKYYIFGKEGCKNLAKEMNVPLLAQIPIVQSICEGGDDGAPAATKVDSITGQAFLSLAQSVVTVVNRRNAEKVTKRRNSMQWFKVPERIYHEMDSIQYLQKLPNVQRVIIVTDKTMINLGYVERVENQLRKRRNQVMIEIYSNVEVDPSVETVLDGANEMEKFKPT